MREPRNPFRLRASEHIESDATFLRLFEPAMLDVLPNDRLWERVWVLRSAPGGGKTSLMRLFTPAVLMTLHAYRSREECRELYGRLADLGVIGDAGPRVLGIMLSCSRNYATLADLELDEPRKDRLLYALLNARVILAALRGAVTLKRLEYPAGVARLSIGSPKAIEALPGLEFPCSGDVLHEWARKVETDVCDTLDSFGPSPSDPFPGHDVPASLFLVGPDNLTIDGLPVAERALVMFDDVHKLTALQRTKLLAGLIDLRSPVSTWVAERFEALSTDQMLSSGARAGRDYEGVIMLEQFWREGGKKQRLERVLTSIADRRARATTAVEMGSFASCLQGSLADTRWQDRMTAAVIDVSKRVRTLVGTSPLYQDWVADREKIQGTPSDLLLGWRTLEILIERDKRRAQKTFDFALTSEELEKRAGSDVEAAAELFLARELELPYYFGPSRLASLASSNIEQYLWLAGDEFEEVVSAVLLKRRPDLLPDRQEAIIRKAVGHWWEEIPQRVSNGGEVSKLLQAIGEYAKWATYQPNAPYSPGVTGIAVSMADRDCLRASRSATGAAAFQHLGSTIASAIKHNLLEPLLDYRVKNNRWMVLYLNRALCVRFALPLHYGGFREQTLAELCQWLEHGFRPRKGTPLL